MGLWTPPAIDEPILLASSYSGTRPITSAQQHTTVTTGTNSKGSWVEFLSDTVITSDICWIDVWPTWNNISATARNSVFDIGIDESGGTSYSVLIPDVCATNCALHTLGGGQRYGFPIHIKAGSAIAMRGQASDSNNTLGISIRAFGRPRSGQPAMAGKYATTFGFNSGSTTGTSITSGTTSEGSWTEIANSISRSHWWWQIGMFSTDSSLTNGNVYHVDLAYGDASNKHIIIQDHPFWISDTNNSLGSCGSLCGCARTVPAGANLYMRMQCSGTADTGLSVTATGIGG